MLQEHSKRWVFKDADPEIVGSYAAELKTSPLLSRLLVLRGFSDTGAVRRYLSSSLSKDLPSPFEMADMEAAVRRIVAAIKNREQIGIWGDYDVDGTTGASVLVSFLREIGAQPIYHVPHRIEEGYGLNVEGLARLKERGVDLVITVDCGISNAVEVAAANAIGLDIVVVDHHQPPPELPPAVAVVNPHRRDCAFPDKGMCAAGLAFYLVIGLRAKLREQGWFAGSAVPDIRRYLDIVTLGTIADMVPLRGVNRTLIRRGLLELAGSIRPGVIALKQVSSIRAGAVTAGQVGFRLGPRINAAGRVDYGIKVVELLTTDSADVAMRIAQELDDHNNQRRTLEAEVLAYALAQAESAADGGNRYSLVLAGEGWHPGVLGIVASRIVERFHRPTVVIGLNQGAGKGSARSIRGFPMVEGFRLCADSLEKFGGHEFAGGLSIKSECLERFTEAFENAARQLLCAEDLMPRLEIDAQLDFSELSLPLLRELKILEPYGIGNPEPLYMTVNAEVCERKVFSAGIRYRLRQGGRVVSGVIFGAGDTFPGVPGERIDVVYRLSENEWNGATSVEMNIVDLRRAQEQ
jgi:single-stranded-DNA-specific exonuclease